MGQHGILWGIDPNTDGPVEKHAYSTGGTIADDIDVKTLCGATFHPVPLDEIPFNLRYVDRCRTCRVTAWGMVNPEAPYPCMR